MYHELKEDIDKVKKTIYEQNAIINKETKKRNSEPKVLELKSTVFEMENLQRDSKADLCRQKKESTNLKIQQYKLILKNRNKNIE